MSDDDPAWMQAGMGQGAVFEPDNSTTPDVSTCIVTGMACPDSNCGKC